MQDSYRKTAECSWHEHRREQGSRTVLMCVCVCRQKVMAGDIVVGDALTTLTRLQVRYMRPSSQCHAFMHPDLWQHTCRHTAAHMYDLQAHTCIMQDILDGMDGRTPCCVLLSACPLTSTYLCVPLTEYCVVCVCVCVCVPPCPPTGRRCGPHQPFPPAHEHRGP